MEIKVFVSNQLQSNMYLLIKEKNCAILDPGSTNMEDVINYIKNNKLNLECIIITHGHFDHTMGIVDIIKYKNVPIYIGEKDKDFLYTPSLSLAIWSSKPFDMPRDVEIIPVKDKDKVYGLTALSAPGHTVGSTLYYCDDTKSLFTGDVLFYRTYGRTDFPTGNYNDMIDTLKMIFELPEETTIYPGHGITSILKNERKYYEL